MKKFIKLILLIGLSTKFVESCSGGGGESTAIDTNTDTNGKPSDGNHSKRHFHFSSCWFMLIVCSKKLSKLAEILLHTFNKIGLNLSQIGQPFITIIRVNMRKYKMPKMYLS